MTSPIPQRGEIWLAALDKRRPVVILTRDPLGRYLHSVIVAPITSTIRGVSTEVSVGPLDGVAVESVVNLDNLQLLERRHLVRPVGKARHETLESVCEAAAYAIGC